MPKVAVVVPTCRGYEIPLQNIDVHWYIVHDEIQRPVQSSLNADVTHIVAPDPLMYGRKCDSIRSAGFLRAYRDGATHILTTDDDCTLSPDWAASHVEALSRSCHPWYSTIEYERSRGMPYDVQRLPVAISHGLWNGVPDLDGETQERNPIKSAVHHNKWSRIAAPFTQSAMNIGFRREVTPVMYQPFQGFPDTPFDRFADIWGGLFAQKALCDDYSFMNGGACVHHTRMSIPNVNVRKEGPGRIAHEKLWQVVWGLSDEECGGSITQRYGDIASSVRKWAAPRKDKNSAYFAQLYTNMYKWMELVNEG